jgi:phage portal protein BeeE
MLVHEIAAEQGWRVTVRRWMERDARPQMVVEFPNDLDGFLESEGGLWEPLARTWRDAMRRSEGDAFNLPAPLPPGAKLRELSGLGETNNIGPTELTLRSKILSALGVPPFLLGAAHEANRASAEASLWAFDFSAVRPWTELIVCAINHQLASEFPGQRVRFADWVWRDRLAESEIDERLLQEKVISPNEARAKRNLPPADWGDLPVGQMQDQPYSGTPTSVPPSERKR